MLWITLATHTRAWDNPARDLAWTQNPGYATLALFAVAGVIFGVNLWVRSWSSRTGVNQGGSMVENLDHGLPGFDSSRGSHAPEPLSHTPVRRAIPGPLVPQHNASEPQMVGIEGQVIDPNKPKMAPEEYWMPYVQTNLRVPHVLIVAETRAGKTFLAQALVQQRPGRVIILDPKPNPGKWGGLPFITIDDDATFASLTKAAIGLKTELLRRLLALKAGKIDEVEQLTIVIDEAPWLAEDCPGAPGLLKLIGRVGAELKMRMIVLSQSDQVKPLGIEGEGDVKKNYAMLYLGSDAIKLRPDLRGVPRPALVKVRGVLAAIDVTGVGRFVKKTIDKSRWFDLPELSDVPAGSQLPAGSDTKSLAEILALLPAPSAEKPAIPTTAAAPEPLREPAAAPEPSKDAGSGAGTGPEQIRNQRDALVRFLVASGTSASEISKILGVRKSVGLAIVREATGKDADASEAPSPTVSSA